MNACDAVVDALAQQQPLSAEARAHVQTCVACAALVRADVQLTSSPRPLVMGSALRDALRDAPAVKPFAAWRRALLPALWMACITVITVVRGVRDNADAGALMMLCASVSSANKRRRGVSPAMVRQRGSPTARAITSVISRSPAAPVSNSWTSARCARMPRTTSAQRSTGHDFTSLARLRQPMVRRLPACSRITGA